MESSCILNTVTTKFQLQHLQLTGELGNCALLSQCQHTITQLHDLINVTEVGFEIPQQHIEIQAREDGRTVLTVCTPPSECITLQKLYHKSACIGTVT